MFSAPKSVSLLGFGFGDPADRESIRSAHAAAVGAVIDHIEGGLLTVSRAGFPNGRAPAEGAVTALFDHLHNAAGEPHLHTHVLLANLAPGPDGSWAAVGGSEWRIRRRALLALYSLSLRDQTRRAGWSLDWRIRPDGLADVADVPRAAVRAASGQSAAVAALGRFEARKRAVSGPRWQPTPSPVDHHPPPGNWPSRDQPDRATSLDLDGSVDMASRVAARLSTRRSHFGRSDVVVALAESYPGGASPDEVFRWTERFCRENVAVPSVRGGPRWTTEMARAADDQLARLACPPGWGTRDPGLADRLGVDGRRVVVLGTQPGESALLAHAHLIESCLPEWLDAGFHVSVECRRERDQWRWQTLTGLGPSPAGRSIHATPTVLLIDQADRRAAPELLSLVSANQVRGGLTVLIEGGTMPRLTEPASQGLVEIGDRVGRIHPPDHLSHDAIDALVNQWSRLDRRSRLDSLLVGLGPEEVVALNSAARRNLVRAGELDPGGPVLVAGSRTFRQGDRVMMFRADGTDRRRGSLGTVSAMTATRQQLGVRWDDGESNTLSGSQIKALGYGYAATPDLARQIDRKNIYLLGPEAALPSLSHRVAMSWPQACLDPMRLDRSHSLADKENSWGLAL